MAQGARGPSEGPEGPPEAQKPGKNLAKKKMMLQVFVNTRFRRPRAAQDAPKEARTVPERPGAAQGRAKRGPRVAKSEFKRRPGSPRTSLEEAQEGSEARGRQESQNGPSEAQTGSQERPGRGPKKAQGRPSIRHKRTQEQRSQGKKVQVETRQQKTRPETIRDNKLTKGLPESLSPEPLGPYSTYFSCI